MTLKQGATNGIGQTAHRNGTEIGAWALARIKATAAGSSGTPRLNQNTGSAVTSIIHGHLAGNAKTLTQTTGNMNGARNNGTGSVTCRAMITGSTGRKNTRLNGTSHANTGINISRGGASTIGVTTIGKSGKHAA